MRILLHDYGGYPFPFQLSHELANRGHDVTHLYAGFTLNGSKRPAMEIGDNLHIRPINIQKPFLKNSYVTRWFQEIEYGKLIACEIAALQPDVALFADSPLDVLDLALRSCGHHSARFIFWVQDSMGLGTHKILKKKLGILGSLIGNHYIRMEKSIARKSDGIILITEDFLPLFDKTGVVAGKVKVIPNWAPIEDIPVLPKKNPWAEKQSILGNFSFLYTGTLGMKHNPDILLQLALQIRTQPDARLVVVSEGVGADWLKQKRAEHSLSNLLILDYQTSEEYPLVLAAGDVLLAILERDAGVFSVPSKVLTYFCAQRALLLAIPESNLAARLVSQNQAGLVVSPDDTAGFVKAAAQLMADANLRCQYAQNARRYAEEHFNIHEITNQFEEILLGGQ